MYETLTEYPSINEVFLEAFCQMAADIRTNIQKFHRNVIFIVNISNYLYELRRNAITYGVPTELVELIITIGYNYSAPHGAETL